VNNIVKYIKGGGLVPGAIIVSFDSGRFDEASSELVLDGDENIGWVIDGQHRLIGAHEARENGSDINLAAVAFLEMPLEKQIELFVTINREAKGVPASLYIDLLKDLPRKKTAKEITDERISDIARRISNDENSQFFQRIIFTRNALAGEVSLVNFARILRPHIARQTGILGIYTQPEQEGAINNYYKALSVSFPRPWEKNVFFKTVGFGGVWRAFPLVFNLTQGKYKVFTVSAIAKILSEIKDFDFEAWLELGTGSAAEIQAGEDLIAELEVAFSADASTAVSLRL
jgi:DGQHR domain-containing protein